MNARMLFAALLGAALGGAAILISPLHSAPMPEPKASPWEYKVVAFGESGSAAADKLTDQFNTLAGNGWEYVGPVQPRLTTPGGGQFVAFRRHKQ